MKVTLHLHDYDYFPYEERFAEREIRDLFDVDPVADNGVLRADIHPELLERADRLTYVAKVCTESGDTIVPNQAKWEATGNRDLFKNGDPTLSKQSTRYSLHGIHEYKGKFNPQMIRTVGNMLGLEAGDTILDPFCGSGTAILEAAHLGWNAVGMDLNPLAVLMTNAKANLLRKGEDQFIEDTRDAVFFISELSDEIGRADTKFSEQDRRKLAEAAEDYDIPNRDYLERWFTDDVLHQLRVILAVVKREVSDEDCADALKVCLSNIVREVSLQEPADLRVRRRKNPKDNYPALDLFCKEVEALTQKLREADAITEKDRLKQTLQQGSVRDSRLAKEVQAAMSEANSKASQIDGAITSPPYASALPYIDTNRLSLLLLGLIQSEERKDTERRLTGHRNIKKTTRRQLDSKIEENAEDLPDRVHSFVREMLDTVRASDIGFRRRNTPALLYNYFSDMQDNFRAVREVVESGCPYALVVGVNKTSPDGENETVIPTPDFLRQIGVECGFEEIAVKELDTYQRYGIHHSNSITDEKLIVLRA